MKTIHIISHTHWDREWHQPFQIFRAKLVVLIDQLLEFFQTNNKYKHFLLDGQTIILEDYAEIRSDNLDLIKEFIQQGNIEIGPWYVLADEFLISPEAHIRNLLFGKRIAKRFGDGLPVGYLPDSFGHIGQMPQILQGFGITKACLQRGLDDQPCELWWQSPDGSKVLLAYLRDGYGNGAMLPMDDQDAFNSELKKLSASLENHSTSTNLLIMQGTDHMFPDDRSGNLIECFNNSNQEIHAIHSSLTYYFEQLQSEMKGKNLPVVMGELRSSKQHHVLPGVLSTRMWIKQRNQNCQSILETILEPISAWLILFHDVETIRYSKALLDKAWKTLLQCHPHDSICGCSIDQVHREMKIRFDQVDQICEFLSETLLNNFSSHIDTQAKDFSAEELGEIICGILVYNPSNHPRSSMVELELPIPVDESTTVILDEAKNSSRIHVTRQEISPITKQKMNREGFISMIASMSQGKIKGLPIEDNVLHSIAVTQNNGVLSLEVRLTNDARFAPASLNITEHELAQIQNPELSTVEINAQKVRTQIKFIAHDVPALGYRTFWLVKSAIKENPKTVDQLSINSDNAIENEFFKVYVSPQNGTLNLFDKRNGLEFTDFHRIVDSGDCGDSYNYCPPITDEMITARLVDYRTIAELSIQILDLKYEIEIPISLDDSRESRSTEKSMMQIIVKVSLMPGVPCVDFHSRVFNNALDHRLRVHFATPYAVNHGYFDGHFEIVKRSLDLPEFDGSWVEDPRPEKPQREFSYIITPDGQGVLVANRGLPEMEITSGNHGHTEFALTLLRCIGWLSRDDFPNRRGQAGPQIPIPEAQMQGEWDFNYTFVPFPPGGLVEAIQLANDINNPLAATPVSLHKGQHPGCASLLQVKPEEFFITSVKPAEDLDGIVIRGYNPWQHTIDVFFKPLREYTKAYRCNLAEEMIGPINKNESAEFYVRVKPYEILSIKLIN